MQKHQQHQKPQHDDNSNKKASSCSYSTDWSPCVQLLHGPILFTSPHGIEVYRSDDDNKEDHQQQLRLHKRERYTQELCVKLALAMHKHLGMCGSFNIWNYKTTAPKDKSNLDPNYLFEHQFAKSPWHQMLLKFKSKFSSSNQQEQQEEQHHKQQQPFLLHIDIHGKKDRENNFDIDVGTMPMQVLWSNKNQYEHLVNTCEEELGKALEKHSHKHVLHKTSKTTGKIKTLKMGVEIEPALHGYWGDKIMTTISHQSVMLGMPAAQLEIPSTMRKALVTDDEFFNDFAAAIANIYTQCAMKHAQIQQQQHENSKSVGVVVASSKEQIEEFKAHVATKIHAINHKHRQHQLKLKEESSNKLQQQLKEAEIHVMDLYSEEQLVTTIIPGLLLDLDSIDKAHSTNI